MGFSLGGPDREEQGVLLHQLRLGAQEHALGLSADGSSGQQFSQQAYVQQVADIAKNKYGYDPGGLGEFSKPNNSNKIFGRVDFNIKSKHQLTIRENYVDALADIGTQYSNTFNFPSNFYHMTDKMLSSVAQLNSSFGKLVQ